MRARQPDATGYAVHDGVRIYYEIHGSGPRSVVLLPTWQIVHSRVWKMQVPFLARNARVVVYDPPGNGRSDRPQEPAAYAPDGAAGDLLAVLDATETHRATLVAYCNSTRAGVLVARDHPERVAGLVAISPNIPEVARPAGRRQPAFDTPLGPEEPVGWDRSTRAYWQHNWPGYVEWFIANVASEPHSTKIFDDLVGWGLETDGPTMLCTVDAADPLRDVAVAEQAIRGLRCPLLVVHGDQDRIASAGCGARWAELTDADTLVVEGGGHALLARQPVVVNHAIRGFLDRVAPAPAPRRTTWPTVPTRRRRALWISSPIGLGHVLRDLAVARELRKQVPDLEVEWLAQPPVTDVLRAEGETVHPASIALASESAHWESEARGHDLHAFYAFRRMDEILLANYHVFDDLVAERPYDVWVGDECWDVDYYLHENPERKTAPYVFTTDVIGFLPVHSETDPREAELCADYNAQMIEHRARLPRLRDLSLFLGGYDELPDASLGPGLPGVRDWARDWFEALPYVVPFDPGGRHDVPALRRALGHDPDAPLVVATVGGTAVGEALLHLVAEGFRALREALPAARMLMVTGPRIDPRDVPDAPGLTRTGYVPDLYRHLAACDAAVVQGGLSTTMELVALGRPFVYFPLDSHWEQQHFVTHRLDHYRAGTRLEFAATSPADLADALRRTLAARPAFRPVPRHGAQVAAERIASLLAR